MNDKTKIKFGGCLNLLCISAAGYLFTKTLIELDKWVVSKECDKRLKEACDAVKTINEIVDKVQSKVKEEDSKCQQS